MARRLSFNAITSVGIALGVVAVAGLSGVNGLGGSVFNASATGSGGTDALNVTINLACTMSGSGGNTYNVAVNPSQTASDIGPTNIKTLCNDGNGYALYAIGYSGDSYTGNNTKLIGTSNNIDTGTSSSAGDNSYWAMKLSPVTGTFAPTIMNSFDSYHAVPSDFTMVAKYTAGTDVGENAEGSTAQAYYEVKASGSQVADTYTGKVKYVLVHPNDTAAPIKPLPDSACPANSICYAPNSSDIMGTMTTGTGTRDLKAITANAQAGRQTNLNGYTNTAITNNSTPTLVAPNYSRDGYGFAGWSTEFDATTATNPVIFGPNQTITTSTTAGAGDADVSSHGLILYPVWIASAGNLQGWTGCSSLTSASYNSTTGVLSATLASMTALTDQRDGNTYAVARLADGNCWMTENLRLDADDTLGDTNKALAQGYGTSVTYGNFTGLAPSEDVNFTYTNPPVANSLYSTDGSTANTIQGGDSSYYYARMPRYNNNNTNQATNATNSAGTTITDSYSAYNDHARWYGYGNYYTWPAAIASVKQYTSPTDTDDEGKTSETAGTSLCPTGWQLPYGRNTGNGATTKGFSYLDTRMGGSGAHADSSTTPTGADRSKMWRQFPNNFVYSGYFNTASADNRGSEGLYWSSIAYSNTNSYYLLLYSSLLSPGTNYSNKYYGYSIRCLASS